MPVDDHVAVPKPGDRSILGRKNKEHQTNCQSWLDNKHPWNCAAHHILPVTCFNPIKCNPKSKTYYVRRCLWVSQWNINGGNKFSEPKGSNNMVRLPTFSAYTKRYASTLAKFKQPVSPVNECSHSGTYGEHYRYNIEVHKYLEDNVWTTLQEDKAKHKNKGKNIKGLITTAHGYFRGELVRRGGRAPGTVNGWLNKKTDKCWALPFSMANDAGPGAGTYCTLNPR